MKSNDWDVIVVGAGVLGVFHAYFAARRGMRTLLVERRELPRQASVRNFGMIAPSILPPGEWRQRGAESAAIYRELNDAFNFPLRRGGTLYPAASELEMAVATEFADRSSRHGYDCRLLTADRVVELAPPVRRDVCQGGLHFPGDMRIEPAPFFQSAIPWMVETLGVQYLPNTVATAIETSGETCRLTTSAGDCFSASRVFICTGADLLTLLPRVYAASGLQYCKLQMLRTAPLPGERMQVSLGSGLSIRRYPSFSICPSWNQLRASVVAPEVDERGIHVLVVQDEQGRLIVGDSHEYSDNEPDERFDDLTEQVILAQAQEFLRPEHWRFAAWPIEQRWCGIYTLHPQNDVFATTIDERIHIVTGIGGKGMSVGPALARESIERCC